MRKIIQISVSINTMYALCDDGTVWYYDSGNYRWNPFKEIPQDSKSGA